jgi:DNA polymerase-3 subunit epsilon
MPTDQHGLFDVAPEQPPAQPAEPKITPDQVQKLRDAFTAAGITSMDDRKAIIESCTVREVATIRDLYAKDVRPILRRIEERKNYQGPSMGSAWDNREEDTWIDRL